MKDLIDRQAAIDIVSGYAEQLNGYIGSPNDSEVYAYARGLILSIERNINAVRPVQPTYTDTEIQKMQDMEQAEIEKAFELGRADAKAEIIHCKDCRYFKSTTSIHGECECGEMWQSLFGETTEVEAINVHKDHYCGYAERRTDD